MFVWPYVRSHILCTQLVICLLSHFIHIWYLIGHDISMRILYRFQGWLNFARVIALFMFVWPYVRSHILCMQLVICLLSHFIHSYLVSWLAMIWACAYYTDFMDGWFLRELYYSPFHVCLTIRPSAHFVLCTQLVICLLLDFIHILYLGWPWSEKTS